MKSTLSVLITGLALTMPLMAAESRPDPLVDPIPEQIQKGDISVKLEDFVQVPRTEDSAMPRQTNGAYARIQYMMPLPDGSGRLVINDLRGPIYLTDENGINPTIYLDMRNEDIDFSDSTFPNETGVAGVAFT